MNDWNLVNRKLMAPEFPLIKQDCSMMYTLFQKKRNIYLSIFLVPLGHWPSHYQNGVELQFHWHTLFSKRKASSKMLRFFWKRVYVPVSKCLRWAVLFEQTIGYSIWEVVMLVYWMKETNKERNWKWQSSALHWPYCMYWVFMKSEYHQSLRLCSLQVSKVEPCLVQNVDMIHMLN